MTSYSRSNSTAPASSSYIHTWRSDARWLAPYMIAASTFGTALGLGLEYLLKGEITDQSGLSILTDVTALATLGTAITAAFIGKQRELHVSQAVSRWKDVEIAILEKQIAASEQSKGNGESGTAGTQGGKGDSTVADTIMTKENNYGLWKARSQSTRHTM